MPDRYTPTPKNDQPVAVCVEISASSDAEADKIIKAMFEAACKAKGSGMQPCQLWRQRFDPQMGSPVFYQP